MVEHFLTDIQSFHVEVVKAFLISFPWVGVCGYACACVGGWGYRVYFIIILLKCTN